MPWRLKGKLPLRPARNQERGFAAPVRARWRHARSQAAGARLGGRLGALLVRPAYRCLFAAQTISRWGNTFNTVAWSCWCSA